MKRIVTLSVLIYSFALIGCATTPPVGYEFAMTKPIDTQAMMYSDDYVDIRLDLSKTWYMGVEGMQQYKNYDGISFLLTNKTNEVMTIDWNRISFKDYSGSSGNAVMHKGVKFRECSSPKSPTIIPPKGKLSDIITPCYAVEFSSSKYAPGWYVYMLPSPRKRPNVEFGLFMPIQIGDQIHNYEFEFRGKKESE